MSFVQKAGCGGFPVARKRYFASLGVVEVDSSFFNLPKLETVQAWRAEAPKGFDFALRAWQLITHPGDSPSYSRTRAALAPKRKAFCGHFKPTPEVAGAWRATKAVAEALGARLLVFETPASFYPDSNHLRDLYRFFREAERGAFSCVWHPRSSEWKEKLVAKVCADLKLVAAARPLEGRPGCGPLNYARLPESEAGYSDAQLRRVRQACLGKTSYVLFRNRASWDDARRYEGLR
jgi:uncharacterized protein YecE (DUF72 family)